MNSSSFLKKILPLLLLLLPPAAPPPPPRQRAPSFFFSAAPPGNREGDAVTKGASVGSVERPGTWSCPPLLSLPPPPASPPQPEPEAQRLLQQRLPRGASLRARSPCLRGPRPRRDRTLGRPGASPTGTGAATRRAAGPPRAGRWRRVVRVRRLCPFRCCCCCCCCSQSSILASSDLENSSASSGVAVKMSAFKGTEGNVGITLAMSRPESRRPTSCESLACSAAASTAWALAGAFARRWCESTSPFEDAAAAAAAAAKPLVGGSSLLAAAGTAGAKADTPKGDAGMGAALPASGGGGGGGAGAAAAAGGAKCGAPVVPARRPQLIVGSLLGSGIDGIIGGGGGGAAAAAAAAEEEELPPITTSPLAALALRPATCSLPRESTPGVRAAPRPSRPQRASKSPSRRRRRPASRPP